MLTIFLWSGKWSNRFVLNNQNHRMAYVSQDIGHFVKYVCR
ncbi:hypothetical protein [Caudoviricetes sp.]|nr:hypothetical protein [Caudoviricetes sp.]